MPEKPAPTDTCDICQIAITATDDVHMVTSYERNGDVTRILVHAHCLDMALFETSLRE